MRRSANSHPPSHDWYAILVLFFCCFFRISIYISKYRSISLLYLRSRGMFRKVLMPFVRISRTISSSLRSVTYFTRNKKSHLCYIADVFLKMQGFCNVHCQNVKSLLRNLRNKKIDYFIPLDGNKKIDYFVLLYLVS